MRTKQDGRAPRLPVEVARVSSAVQVVSQIAPVVRFFANVFARFEECPAIQPSRRAIVSDILVATDILVTRDRGISHLTRELIRGV